MRNVIRLTNIDFKNIIKTKGFWISVLIALFYVSIWISRKPKSFSAENYQFEFFRVVLFILIYYSSAILSKEFKFGTAKALFTGTFTRVEILIEKLLVIMELGVFFGLFSRLLNIAVIYRITGSVKMSDILNENIFYTIIIYLLISLVIGSFGLLISVITGSQNSSLVYNFILFGVFQYFMPLFMILNSKDSLSILDKVITKLPNYIIFTWAEFWQFTNMEVLAMLIYGSLFFIPSIFLISRKNLI